MSGAAFYACGRHHASWILQDTASGFIDFVAKLMCKTDLTCHV